MFLPIFILHMNQGGDMKGVNNVNAYSSVNQNQIKNNNLEKNSEKTNSKESKEVVNESVKYEKSEDVKKYELYNSKGKKLDVDTINKMKEDAELHYKELIESVRNMISQQGLKAGALPKELEFFDKIPKTIEELRNADGYKAENEFKVQDLNDPNNYWSAEQTSDRIVEFAKQISGGDTEKLELLKGAIEKGFSIVESYFDEMPSITGKTHDLIMEKLDKWANPKQDEEPKDEKEVK